LNFTQNFKRLAYAASRKGRIPAIFKNLNKRKRGVLDSLPCNQNSRSSSEDDKNCVAKDKRRKRHAAPSPQKRRTQRTAAKRNVVYADSSSDESGSDASDSESGDDSDDSECSVSTEPSKHRKKTAAKNQPRRLTRNALIEAAGCNRVTRKPIR
jgi:hypothetical protein